MERFNQLSQQNPGLYGLAAARIRRPTASRSGRALAEGLQVAFSDTYLDVDLYHKALNELTARFLENFLLEMVQKHGLNALDDPQSNDILAGIAISRGIFPEDALRRFKSKVGLVGVLSDDKNTVEFYNS